MGFAAYLLFMKCRGINGRYTGQINGTQYPVQDDQAAYFAEKWNNNNVNEVVDTILADKKLWETDLSSLNGFAEAVKMNLNSLMQNGVIITLRSMLLNKTVV